MVRIKKSENIKAADRDNSENIEKYPQGKSGKFSSMFYMRSWKHIIIIILLVVGLLFWKFKGLFIAAVVNSQPISRFQLDDQLRKKFGDKILDGMINERLILAAARQKGIFITNDEIDNRIKQIEDRLKGRMTLDDALKAQGLSKDDLRGQVEIQLSIDKMFSSEATISADEINSYIEKNKESTKTATDQAQLRNDVENILKQQKVSDLFDKWFADVRKGAKIEKYL